jgi:hypothetical protein
MLTDIYACLARDVVVVFVPSDDEYLLIPSDEFPLLCAINLVPLEKSQTLDLQTRDALGAFLGRDVQSATFINSGDSQKSGIDLGLWHERASKWITRRHITTLPHLVRVALVMFRVNYMQRNRRMVQMLEFANASVKGKVRHGDPHAHAQAIMSAVVDLAPFTYDRLECLGAACILTREMRRIGFPATLHIGIRTFPFEAHAWSMLDDEVLAEDPRLPNQLDIIYRGH